MRLSARNQLKGKVVSIERGPIHSKVRIDIGGGNQITSVISTEAVDDLKLSNGAACVAVIKASSVMVGVDH
jgi:molybdopterin-binding protein